MVDRDGDRFFGVNLGSETMEASGFAVELILTGAAATLVAYLFFWPIVHAVARRVFGFKRDVSAVLAFGISICGVSAAHDAVHADVRRDGRDHGLF